MHSLREVGSIVEIRPRSVQGVFVSTPLSMLLDSDFKQMRDFCLRLRRTVEDEIGGFEVYCAALNIGDVQQFDAPEASAMKDLNAIEQLSAFVFLYPKPILSSAFIELGYALALRKRMLLLVPNRSDLPFLARGLTAGTHLAEIALCDPFVDESLHRILDFLRSIRNQPLS